MANHLASWDAVLEVAHPEATDYKVELVKELMKEVRFGPIIHKWLQKRHILKGEVSIGQKMNNDVCPNSKQLEIILQYIYMRSMSRILKSIIRSLNIISLIEQFVL